MLAYKNEIDRLRAEQGGSRALGELLNPPVSAQAVSFWARRGWVPRKRAVELEKLFNVSRFRLMKPDMAEMIQPGADLI